MVGESTPATPARVSRHGTVNKQFNFFHYEKTYSCGYWRGQPPIACSSCLTTWRAHPVSVHTKNIKNNNQTSKTLKRKNYADTGRLFLVPMRRNIDSSLHYLRAYTTRSTTFYYLLFIPPLEVGDGRYEEVYLIEVFLELLLYGVGIIRRKVKI